MKFPYREYYVEPTPTLATDTIVRPVIPLRIIGSTSTLLVSGLLDTGADETLLPQSLADAVGVLLDYSQRWMVTAFGGQELEAILGEIEFEIGRGRSKFRWSAKIGFVSLTSAEEEAVVLGQLGFLEYFKASFNRELRQVSLTPNARLQALQAN